jgi:GH24 family phage-related lysozyme (muramidase)
MTNLGLVVNGRLADGAYDSYLLDVMNQMNSGSNSAADKFESIGVKTEKMEPISGSISPDLTDRALFSDFHARWQPAYEKMVVALDVPGATPFASIFVIDPSAIATSAGLSPPLKDGQPLTTADITEIITNPAAGAKAFGAVPPGGSDIFEELNINKQISLSDNPESPATAAAVTAQVADKATSVAGALAAAAGIPPVPPIPELPLSELLDFGYTEQFNFEMEQAMAPVKAQLAAAQTMADPQKVVEVVSNLPAGLVQVAYDAVTSAAPKSSMETSVLEKAAQKVLNDHQVRLQSLVTLGQNIGDGDLLSAQALTLEVLIQQSDQALSEQAKLAKLGQSSSSGNRIPFKELNPSEKLLGFIKGHEGLRLFKYYPSEAEKASENPTIGYGHRLGKGGGGIQGEAYGPPVPEPGGKPPQIDIAKAEALLRSDIFSFKKQIESASALIAITNANFLQQEFDMIIDIVYGYGVKGFVNNCKDIIDAISSGLYDSVPALILQKIKTSAGNTAGRLRKREAQYWSTGDYDPFK